jgi:hypothetical protein
MVMKFVLPALLGLSVLVGAAVGASAADCKLKGWTEGDKGVPIFQCPDKNY